MGHLKSAVDVGDGASTPLKQRMPARFWAQGRSKTFSWGVCLFVIASTHFQEGAWLYVCLRTIPLQRQSGLNQPIISVEYILCECSDWRKGADHGFRRHSRLQGYIGRHEDTLCFIRDCRALEQVPLSMIQTWKLSSQIALLSKSFTSLCGS